jgi:hypothetical protein
VACVDADKPLLLELTTSLSALHALRLLRRQRQGVIGQVMLQHDEAVQPRAICHVYITQTGAICSALFRAFVCRPHQIRLLSDVREPHRKRRSSQ